MNRRVIVAILALSGFAYGQVEPQAGRWKTWVIPSGQQLRLSPPPDQSGTQEEIAWLRSFLTQRNATARQQIDYWDAGAPGYRWFEIAMAEIVRNGVNNVRGGRVMALMQIAIYDAMVATWDSKYAYNRPRPEGVDASLANPLNPSYPSEHAVAAGAASAVLAYLFPASAQRFTDLAEEAGRSRLFAGVQYPSDVIAGLDLGRRVAALVIDRAKADGSDAVWTGTVPSDPGKWTGRSPAEPLAGTWKPWLLSSGSQFRPGPPPPHNSAQQATELAEVKNFTRTFDSNFATFYWQSAGAFKLYGDMLHQKLFEYRLDTNAPRSARALALMSVANYDANVACWDAKFTYWAIRPFQLDPTVTTLFPTPNHPSYPAAHACNDAAIAPVLGHLFPSDAAYFAARAQEASDSRLWGGIHFRSDLVAGNALGSDVAQVVINWAKADGSQ